MKPASSLANSSSSPIRAELFDYTPCITSSTKLLSSDITNNNAIVVIDFTASRQDIKDDAIMRLMRDKKIPLLIGFESVVKLRQSGVGLSSGGRVSIFSQPILIKEKGIDIDRIIEPIYQHLKELSAQTYSSLRTIERHLTKKIEGPSQKFFKVKEKTHGMNGNLVLEKTERFSVWSVR